MEKSEEEATLLAELVTSQVPSLMHHDTIGILTKDSIQIQKGASSARSDDTKTLKGAVLDWITPNNQALMPPLSRNLKTN